MTPTIGQSQKYFAYISGKTTAVKKATSLWFPIYIRDDSYVDVMAQLPEASHEPLKAAQCVSGWEWFILLVVEDLDDVE